MRLVASLLTITTTILVAVAGGCGGGDDGPGDGGGQTPDAPGGVGEPPGLAGITLAHNQFRADHGVPPLVWDPALAATAQAWADSCVDMDTVVGLVDHNPNRSDGQAWPYVGENIFGSSGPASPLQAVTAWVDEEQYYDYASNSCAAGQICGHYTQVVWAASTNLGCGLSNCPGLTYGNTIVCDYGPGGNDGGRPY